jgi:hypothetical protein
VPAQHGNTLLRVPVSSEVQCSKEIYRSDYRL